MAGHTHLKCYQFEETFDVYMQSKNQFHPSRFSCDIVKMLQTCYFGYYGHAWLHIPKVKIWISRKLSCLFEGKDQLHHSRFSGNIAKICKLLYFGYFGHARQQIPKLILSTCRKLWHLSASQKYTSSFATLLRYYILKNPAIWLTNSILADNLKTRVLSYMGLAVK